MKRKLLAPVGVTVCLLTLAFLAGGAQPSNRLSISVPVSDISQTEVRQVSDNQTIINIGQFPQGGKPGEPMLPFKQVCLLVPPDADLEMVSASLTSESWEELPGQYEIAAVKPAATWDGEKFIISWGKDPSVIVNGQRHLRHGRIFSV
jgi:hypothetical protein